MKIKVKRNSKNITNYKPNKFGHLAEKLRNHKKQNITCFPATYANLRGPTISQIRARSNPILQAESEHQKCNGLLYANITRFR